VDTRTERAILGSLQGVIDRCTSLIISHRLSAVCGADEILVLEAGEVRARGTHDELLRRGGYYAETWRRQSLEEELEELD
jgi:ABC-type transport system involved in Fe-S cluster assembly fused permease/ATPase subunit